MCQEDLHRLALAIRATLGIEVLVWLTDVAGQSRKEAVEIMRSSRRWVQPISERARAADTRFPLSS
jgi:hypothetical protein